ncbi:MAG: polysaccharide pyruvyl transferase family protein, partial [Thermodesulfobacteriota bacterium]
MKGLINKPTVCLLGATFNTNNMGVSALTAGIIKSILHQLPDSYIYLLNYGRDSMTFDVQIDGNNISIQQFNMRFSKKVYLKNNIVVLILLSLFVRLIRSFKIQNKLISKNTHLKYIEEADIVLSIAGGDSFSDIYGLTRFLYVSLPQLLAIFMRKKLILLPQSLGPFSGRFAKGMARYIMNRANMIYSRDYCGVDEIKRFMGDGFNSKKIKFCYDVAFIVDPIKPDIIDIGDCSEIVRSNSNVVGLNVSGLLFKQSYNTSNCFGLKVDYRGFIFNLIDFLIMRKNAVVLLVPHVFGGSNDLESDSVVCEEIFEKSRLKYKDKLFLTRGNYNYSELKYIIGLCDFFIGSRMHSCIAALSQEVPAVAFAYSNKFHGVMDSIGLTELV